MQHAEYMLTHFCLMQALAAGHRWGVWEYMRLYPAGVPVATLAHELGVRHSILQALLDYIAVHTDIVSHAKDGFRFSEQAFAMVRIDVEAVAAYYRVFNNLEHLLEGTVTYAAEPRLHRSARHLHRASTHFTRPAHDRVLDNIVHRQPHTVVDIGCGDGYFITRVVRSTTGIRCIGVDNDADALAYGAARKDASAATFLTGDLRQVEWYAPKGSAVVYVAMAVVHELFREGRSAVVDFIRDLRRHTPGGTLILVEFLGRESVELAREGHPKRKRVAAFYQLLHPLTDQGLPQQEATWTDCIAEAGASLDSLSVTENNLGVFTVRL